MRGDLEDGVGRRVDDPLARLLMLLAELLDDVRARRGLVPEHAAAGLVHERVDHVVREAVRIGRHRGRRDDAHQLPVAGRRVLALRPLEQPAGDRGSARLRRAALELHHVAEAERLQCGQVETSDGAGHVAERVRSLISEIGRIGQLSRADGIEHDYARPRHVAIVRRARGKSAHHPEGWRNPPGRSARSLRPIEYNERHGREPRACGPGRAPRPRAGARGRAPAPLARRSRRGAEAGSGSPRTCVSTNRSTDLARLRRAWTLSSV